MSVPEFFELFFTVVEFLNIDLWLVGFFSSKPFLKVIALCFICCKDCVRVLLRTVLCYWMKDIHKFFPLSPLQNVKCMLVSLEIWNLPKMLCSVLNLRFISGQWCLWLRMVCSTNALSKSPANFWSRHGYWTHQRFWTFVAIPLNFHFNLSLLWNMKNVWRDLSPDVSRLPV